MRSRRIDIELQLETNLREAKYSPALLALMEKEDSLIRARSDCDDISKIVDTNIERETLAFNVQQTKQHISKWNHLSLHYNETYDPSKASKSSPLNTLDDLEIESLRLEADYNDNWYDYEAFNLEEAFRLQSLKIDSEFSTYEKPLAMKLGQYHSTDNLVIGADNRWHHPEKQRRLIHTAPVMSPTSSQSIHRTHRSIPDESEDIRRIKLALENLIIQKNLSKRWMKRQKVKLLTTALSMGDERKVIAKVLRQEIKG